MIERGRGARFDEQLLLAVSIARRGDELEGDLAVEHHIVSKADLSHSAASDNFEDLVAPLRHHWNVSSGIGPPTHHSTGRIFWLWWKTLSGSYMVFTSTSRS